MQHKFNSVQDLGLVIRATRKANDLRLDDTASGCQVGPVFLREVERGKDTVQFGRVLQVLNALGLQLSVTVTEAALVEYEKLKKTGLKPLPKRSRQPTKPAA